eukprot:scaffold323823_cov44-Tisochrysis_lutea.AAC.1
MGRNEGGGPGRARRRMLGFDVSGRTRLAVHSLTQPTHLLFRFCVHIAIRHLGACNHERRSKS